MSNMPPTPRPDDDARAQLVTTARATAFAWNERGRWDEAAALLRATRPLAREQSHLDEARLLVDLVRVLNGQDFLQAYRNGAEVAALLDAIDAEAAHSDDRRLAGDALHERALHLHLRYFSDGGDPERERELLDAAIATRREAGDRWGEAMSIFYRGCVDHVIHADAECALPFFEQAYAIGGEIGAPVVQSYAARHIGQIDQERGDLDRALERLVESHANREQAGWRVGTAPALIALAEIHRVRGEQADALDALARARVVCREIDAVFLFEIACTEYELLAAGSRAGGANVRVVIGPAAARQETGFGPSAGPQDLVGGEPRPNVR